MFLKRKTVPLTPPPGLGKKDIGIEKSICTGEAVIGFREPHTGKLLLAVPANSEKEIADFYRRYGFEPPK